MMKLWNRVSIHPFTYFMLLLGLLCGFIKYILIIMCIIIIHEIGHISWSLIFRRVITKVELLPFGGLIKIDGLISSNIYEDLIISVGGILNQLLLGTCLNTFYKFGLINYELFSIFSYYNVIIILFNLIPICPLDGYRIFKLILELFLPFRGTFLISFIISLIFIIVVLIINPDLIFTNSLIFIFIISKSITEYKSKNYIMNRFYLERMNYNFKWMKIINIGNINNMFKNRFNIIKGWDEDIYIKKYVFM